MGEATGSVPDPESLSRLRPICSKTDYLLPPSVQEWLPETHLARYVAEVFEALDLSVSLTATIEPPMIGI